MKALVYHSPGDLRWEEVPTPQVAPNEALIKIKAVGVCGSDIHGYLGKTGRRIPPLIMGHEFSGEITEVGREVKRFKVGDRVTVQPVNFCEKCIQCRQGRINLCLDRKVFGVLTTNGAMAEYLAVPEKLIFKLPANVSYEQGTMIEPLSVALRAVEKTPKSLYNNIGIVGVGTIGLLALQLVRLCTLGKIIVTDLLDYRLSLAKKLGADVAINPQREDPVKKVKEFTGGIGVDAAIEAVGLSSSVEQALSITKTGGHIIWIGNYMRMIELNMQDVVTRELSIYGTFAYTEEEFGKALEILATGKVNINPLFSLKEPLSRGPEVFRKMAKGEGDLIKAILVG